MIQQIPIQRDTLRNDTRSDSIDKTNSDSSPIRKFEKDINPNVHGLQQNNNHINTQNTQQPLKLNFDLKPSTESQIPSYLPSLQISSYLPKYQSYYQSPLPPKIFTSRSVNQIHHLSNLNQTSYFKTQKDTQLYTQRQINPQDFKLFQSPDKKTHYSFTENQSQNVTQTYRPLSTLTSPYSPINPQLSKYEGGNKQKYSVNQFSSQLYKRIERTPQNNLTVLQSQSAHNENHNNMSTYTANRPLTNYQYKLNSTVKQSQRPLTSLYQQQQKYYNLFKTNIFGQPESKLEKNQIDVEISEIKRPYFQKKYGEKRMLRRLGAEQDPVVIMKTDWCSVLLLSLVLLVILGLGVYQLRESFEEGKIYGKEQKQQVQSGKVVTYEPIQTGRENKTQAVQVIPAVQSSVQRQREQFKISNDQKEPFVQQLRPSQVVKEQYRPIEQVSSQQQFPVQQVIPSEERTQPSLQVYPQQQVRQIQKPLTNQIPPFKEQQSPIEEQQQQITNQPITYQKVQQQQQQQQRVTVLPQDKQQQTIEPQLNKQQQQYYASQYKAFTEVEEKSGQDLYQSVQVYPQVEQTKTQQKQSIITPQTFISQQQNQIDSYQQSRVDDTMIPVTKVEQVNKEPSIQIVYLNPQQLTQIQIQPVKQIQQVVIPDQEQQQTIKDEVPISITMPQQQQQISLQTLQSGQVTIDDVIIPSQQTVYQAQILPVQSQQQTIPQFQPSTQSYQQLYPLTYQQIESQSSTSAITSVQIQNIQFIPQQSNTQPSTIPQINPQEYQTRPQLSYPTQLEPQYQSPQQKSQSPITSQQQQNISQQQQTIQPVQRQTIQPVSVQRQTYPQKYVVPVTAQYQPTPAQTQPLISASIQYQQQLQTIPEEPAQILPYQTQIPTINQNNLSNTPTTFVQYQPSTTQPNIIQPSIQPSQTTSTKPIQAQSKQQLTVPSTQIPTQQVSTLQQQTQQKQIIIFMQSPPQFFTYPENVVSTKNTPKQTIIQTLPGQSPSILQKGYDWESLQINTVNFAAHLKLDSKSQKITEPAALPQRHLKTQSQ